MQNQQFLIVAKLHTANYILRLNYGPIFEKKIYLKPFLIFRIEKDGLVKRANNL